MNTHQHKRQWTPQRTKFECPSSVARHSPVATSQTLSVSSCDPDTTRRPSGETATPMTYDEDTSSQKYSGRRAPHLIRVPSQRRHALAGRHVPHLEHSWSVPPLYTVTRNDASPVRKHGNAEDLRRRHIITTEQQKVDAARRTLNECPTSVATHSPVSMSHTLSSSHELEPTRRPSGGTPTP